MPLAPSEALTYNTVRLECRLKDGGTSTGTAFAFAFLPQGDKNVPVLVTNRHVVAGTDTGTFFLHLAEDGVPKRGSKAPVTLNAFEQRWLPHPDPAVDLCVMPLAPVLHEANAKGLAPFFVPLDKSLIPSSGDLEALMALEDVVMIGYPIGIWDSHNNMPVIRKGITATHPANDYEGRKEFMIDLACFPGSSGSPVFLFNVGSYATRQGATVIGNRIKLLGILYAGPQFTAEGHIRVVNVPTQQVAVTVAQIPCNLGICIRGERLLDFEPVLEKLIAA